MPNQHNILQQDIKYLKGVGPKKSAVFNTLGIYTLEDLVYYFPRTYLDRTRQRSIGALIEGEMTTVVGQIHQVMVQGQGWRNKRLKVVIKDNTGMMELIWFQGAAYLEKKFHQGDALAVFGKVGFFNRTPQMNHPEFDQLSQSEDPQTSESSDFERFNTGQIVALYPLTEALKKLGITSRSMRQLINQAYGQITPYLEDHFPESFLQKSGLPQFREALKDIHFPSSKENLAGAIYRLKFSELFFLQLMFALRKHKQESRQAMVFETVGSYTHRLYESLPFEMTNAQKDVVRHIRHDLKKGIQMHRLVQGDVGSGKSRVGLGASHARLTDGDVVSKTTEDGAQAELHAPIAGVVDIDHANHELLRRSVELDA
jgi:ATP-dependent DNA helicase RecG